MAEKKKQLIWQAVEELHWDLWLAVPAVGLVIFGVIMVYSASAGTARPQRFLFSQMAAAAIGLTLMSLLRRVDYHRYAHPGFVYGFLGVCVVLLMAVFFFRPVNGARRWIMLGGISAQPSELAKIALIVFLAWFLAEQEKEKLLPQFWATIAPAAVILGILSALILKEPDLGTTGILGLIFVTMLYVAGAQVKYLLLCLPALGVGVAALIYLEPYRLDRFKAFMNPEADPLGKGYHILQSLTAIGSGGIHGLGLGKGRQKLSFLPEPQSDFIFPVIAEELGLIGATTLILVFGFFLWRGLRAGSRAPDLTGRLLAIGITTWITVQAFFNISVALKLVPAKGITLPFISAGGSSLIAVLIATGILLNVSAQGKGRAN